MSIKSEQTVLFLCTGNYYRSRFAEILFNSMVLKLGLPWRASSRGLALERGIYNVGPMAKSAVVALERRGLTAMADFKRMPMQATDEDFENADRAIALKHEEHLPLMQERYTAWVDKVEYWRIDDVPGALALVEREVEALIAELSANNQPHSR